MIEFQPFPKIARLSREVVITEKIDGTNAQVIIDEEGNIVAGSRSRIITPESDNFGFAKWVQDHRDELMQLGPGRHFGEWWGGGIQRGYGLTEKRFSLFNVDRYAARPACCHVVPTLYRGVFNSLAVDSAIDGLKIWGSRAALGFAKPEGVVIYHTAAGISFKKTLERDDEWKGKVAA